MSQTPQSVQAATPVPGKSRRTENIQMVDLLGMVGRMLMELPDRSLKCDHCGVSFSAKLIREDLPGAKRNGYGLLGVQCVSCKGHMVYLAWWEDPSAALPMKMRSIVRLWPQTPYVFVAAEVPQEIAKEFQEASAVLAVSPKASAALSRRLLQRLLHDSGIKKRDLAAEIDEYLKTNPPSYIAEALHAVRQVGNFAAHPQKSKNTGEVIDVEPGEAEWLLGTITGLFDHMFVQPTRARVLQARLVEKLEQAGKGTPKLSSR